MPGTGTQGTKGTEEGHTAKPPPQKGEQREAEVGGEAKKRPPPPHSSQVPRLVLASCSQRAWRKDNKGARQTGGGKTTREGTECVAPADKAAGWGGSRERARYHRAVPAECSHRACPQRRERQGRVHKLRRATKEPYG